MSVSLVRLAATEKRFHRLFSCIIRVHQTLTLGVFLHKMYSCIYKHNRTDLRGFQNFLFKALLCKFFFYLEISVSKLFSWYISNKSVLRVFKLGCRILGRYRSNKCMCKSINCNYDIFRTVICTHLKGQLNLCHNLLILLHLFQTCMRYFFW